MRICRCIPFIALLLSLSAYGASASGQRLPILEDLSFPGNISQRWTGTLFAGGYFATAKVYWGDGSPEEDFIQGHSPHELPGFGGFTAPHHYKAGHYVIRIIVFSSDGKRRRYAYPVRISKI